MEWIKVVIYTSTEGIEPLCDKLYDLSYTGVQIEDESEFNEFLENNKKYWDYVDDELIESMHGETKIIFYIESDESLNDKIASVRQMLSHISVEDTDRKYGRLELDIDKVNEEDWANNWKKYFKPLEVGKKILIQPQWEPYEGETDRIIFKVNPGLTFGTGTHNSTKLCICELEKFVTEETRVLDIGCGSGILSVISLMLGAPDAVAVDIDPNSVHTAYDNARMNNVDINRYKVYAGDILTDSVLLNQIGNTKYDVIVANIVADVIIALLPLVRELINESGTFICSGIIHERLNDVTCAMKNNGIAVSDINKDGEWASVTCIF